MFYSVHSSGIQRQNYEPEGKTEERKEFEAKLFPKCYLKQNNADSFLLLCFSITPLKRF